MCAVIDVRQWSTGGLNTLESEVESLLKGTIWELGLHKDMEGGVERILLEVWLGNGLWSTIFLQKFKIAFKRTHKSIKDVLSTWFLKQNKIEK